MQKLRLLSIVLFLCCISSSVQASWWKCEWLTRFHNKELRALGGTRLKATRTEQDGGNIKTVFYKPRWFKQWAADQNKPNDHEDPRHLFLVLKRETAEQLGIHYNKKKNELGLPSHQTLKNALDRLNFLCAFSFYDEIEPDPEKAIKKLIYERKIPLPRQGDEYLLALTDYFLAMLFMPSFLLDGSINRLRLIFEFEAELDANTNLMQREEIQEAFSQVKQEGYQSILEAIQGFSKASVFLFAPDVPEFTHAMSTIKTSTEPLRRSVDSVESELETTFWNIVIFNDTAVGAEFRTAIRKFSKNKDVEPFFNPMAASAFNLDDVIAVMNTRRAQLMQRVALQGAK